MSNNHPDPAARLRAAAALVLIHLDTQPATLVQARAPGLTAAISALRGYLAAHAREQASITEAKHRAAVQRRHADRDPSTQYRPEVDQGKIDSLAGDLELAEEYGHG